MIIQVSFPVWEYSRIAPWARESRDFLADDAGHADAFLVDLGMQRGQARGPKGGLFSWGYVAKEFDVDKFVGDLAGFWRGLFDDERGDDLPMGAHVLIVSQAECQTGLDIVEIGRGETGRADVEVKRVVVRGVGFGL